MKGENTSNKIFKWYNCVYGCMESEKQMSTVYFELDMQYDVEFESNKLEVTIPNENHHVAIRSFVSDHDISIISQNELLYVLG